MKNSRSTASYLRADIQKLKEEHLFHNLSKQIESTSKLLNLSQDEKDDTLSTADKYDLKAYQFNQYFPVPAKSKTDAEELEEERKKLGLQK